MPVFLLLVLLFLVWFTYERKKSSRASDERTKNFWERERSASFVPRQSTDDIPFVHLSADLIPDDSDDEELSHSCAILRGLVDRPVADLSELSNTDLKLRYGTGNFTMLSAADSDYSAMYSAIAECCERLTLTGRNEEAYRLLSFAYGAGMHSSAIILPYAELLTARNEADRLRELVEAAVADPTCPQTTADRLRNILNNTMNP